MGQGGSGGRKRRRARQHPPGDVTVRRADTAARGWVAPPVRLAGGDLRIPLPIYDRSEQRAWARRV
eukprot:gene50464-43056_t